MLTHDDVVRLYGPWQDRTPRDAARLLDGYGGAWWVAGGWAVEAFTGVHRDHGDVDVSIPAVDVPLLREHLGGRWHVWAAFDGAVRPLVAPQEELPEGCENLWLGTEATSTWLRSALELAHPAHPSLEQL